MSGLVLLIATWNGWVSYKNGYAGLLVLHQGVIQEFSVAAVKHDLEIFNRAEGFSSLCMSKVFPCMASKCSENALKYTAKTNIFVI